MTVTIKTVVCQRQEVLSADVDGEFVLMSVERGQYYGLDDVGSAIWRRLEKPVSVADLCASLGTEFDGDAQTIADDVLALLNELESQDLIATRAS